MEDIEIDIRPIVRKIIGGWRLIGLTAILFALISAALSFSRAQTYAADAQIAIVQQDTQVDLKSNIKDQPTPVDPGALRTSLLTLAQNGSVAQEVITTLGNKLTSDLRDPKALQSHIAVDAKGNTNVLQVHVTAPKPEEAQAIATSWSNAYVKLADEALGKHAASGDMAAELERARASYAAKQQELSASTLPQAVTQLRRQVKGLMPL